MIAVEGRGLSKAYGTIKGGIHAVNDLSFAIGENKITGLIGRNGAGKTTLLKMIAGYLRPTQGELRVFKQNPFNNLAVSANTIFVDDAMVFPVEQGPLGAGRIRGYLTEDIACRCLRMAVKAEGRG